MAESNIEIISVESNVEDGSNTPSTNTEFRNNAIIKEEPPSESSLCNNCSQEFPDIKNHLSSSRGCFFPLTKGYWYKPLDKEQLCKICEENLQDNSKLKEHCFENKKCRYMYIEHYVTFGEKATVVSADTDVKSELSAPISDYSGSERIGDIPRSQNEPAVAGSSRVEVNYRTTNGSASSTEECVSSDDQRHNVSRGNVKDMICRACNNPFDSEKRLKQHLTASIKCSEQLRMTMNASNNPIPQQTTRSPYKAAPISSNPKVGHHESSSKRDNQPHPLPGESGSFSHNEDTRPPIRVTLAVKPAVGASVTNSTEATSYSAPYIPEDKRHTKRKRSSNLICGKCENLFATSDDFLLHTVKKSRCFSYYETENTEVSVPYCFKCKRSFQTCKLCSEHQCLGLVKYQCSQCDGIFDCISSLRTHEGSTHKRK